MRNHHLPFDRPLGGAWNAENGLAALRDLLGGAPRADRAGGTEVRTAILELLLEQPMHGYQLIHEIEQRSGGTWRPSPGSVYPTLQLLDDEGLVVADTTGERRVYSLTEQGRQLAAAQQTTARGDSRVRRVAERASALPKAGVRLAQAMSQFGPDATDQQVERAVQVVEEARRKLYAILAED